MDNLVDLYVNVDDFLQGFLGKWYKTLISSGDKKRLRSSKLSQSEIITIVIIIKLALVTTERLWNYYMVFCFIMNHIRAFNILRI